MRSRKKKPSNAKSRRHAQIFFVINIGFLIAMWLLTRFYAIPPLEILLSWMLLTTIMIVVLWFVDQRAARMVLEDLSRSP